MQGKRDQSDPWMDKAQVGITKLNLSGWPSIPGSPPGGWLQHRLAGGATAVSSSSGPGDWAFAICSLYPSPAGACLHGLHPVRTNHLSLRASLSWSGFPATGTCVLVASHSIRDIRVPVRATFLLGVTSAPSGRGRPPHLPAQCSPSSSACARCPAMRRRKPWTQSSSSSSTGAGGRTRTGEAGPHTWSPSGSWARARAPVATAVFGRRARCAAVIADEGLPGLLLSL